MTQLAVEPHRWLSAGALLVCQWMLQWSILLGYSMVWPVGFLRFGEGTLAAYGLAPAE